MTRVPTLLVAFALCGGCAIWQAPSWAVAVLYGLPTWLGGVVFTLLFQDAQDRLRPHTDEGERPR